MNKTVAFAAFATLAALGIIGSVVLLIHRPDASATFTTFVLQILGLVTVGAGTFYALGKTNEKLDLVQKQTNGTLSALQERLAEKDAHIAQLSADKVELARQVSPATTVAP